MMLKLVFLFLINFSIGIELALFLYLIDRKVSVRQFLFLLLLKPLFNFICNLTRWGILPYFSEEIFYFSTVSSTGVGGTEESVVWPSPHHTIP